MSVDDNTMMRFLVSTKYPYFLCAVRIYLHQTFHLIIYLSAFLSAIIAVAPTIKRESRTFCQFLCPMAHLASHRVSLAAAQVTARDESRVRVRKGALLQQLSGSESTRVKKAMMCIKSRGWAWWTEHAGVEKKG